MPLTAFSQQASQQASEETPGLVNWSRVLNAIEGINNIRHFPDQVESLNRDQVCPSREPNLSPDSRVVERICACEGCSSPLHNPPLFAQAIQPPAGFLIKECDEKEKTCDPYLEIADRADLDLGGVPQDSEQPDKLFVAFAIGNDNRFMSPFVGALHDWVMDERGDDVGLTHTSEFTIGLEKSGHRFRMVLSTSLLTSKFDIETKKAFLTRAGLESRTAIRPTAKGARTDTFFQIGPDEWANPNKAFARYLGEDGLENTPITFLENNSLSLFVDSIDNGGKWYYYSFGGTLYEIRSKKGRPFGAAKQQDMWHRFGNKIGTPMPTYLHLPDPNENDVRYGAALSLVGGLQRLIFRSKNCSIRVFTAGSTTWDSRQKNSYSIETGLDLGLKLGRNLSTQFMTSQTFSFSPHTSNYRSYELNIGTEKFTVFSRSQTDSQNPVFQGFLPNPDGEGFARFGVRIGLNR